jgi:hypothetical protein
MVLAASDGQVTLPGMHTPGPSEPSEILVERRDGTVERIECAGGHAYAAMVRHFTEVAGGGVEPVFGRAESVRLAAAIQALHVASVH